MNIVLQDYLHKELKISKYCNTFVFCSNDLDSISSLHLIHHDNGSSVSHVEESHQEGDEFFKYWLKIAEDLLTRQNKTDTFGVYPEWC